MRFTRIDLVLDAVKAGHQQGCRSTGTGSRRDQGNGPQRAWLWGFLSTEYGHKPTGCGRNRRAERVLQSLGSDACSCWCRVGEGVQRFGVLQNAADVNSASSTDRRICHLRTAACRLSRSTCSRACRCRCRRDWLRHEGRRFAIGVGDLWITYLYFLQIVGLLGQRSEDQTQLVLAGRHFVVVLVDLHTHDASWSTAFRRMSCASSIGFDREIAAFDAGRWPMLPIS